MACLARYSTIWLKFGDGKHRFLLEDMCGKACEEGENVCEACSRPKQRKTQDVRTFDHGLLTGFYTPESHMFDSPWFHSALEKYGEPKAEDLEKAMETQRKARGKVKGLLDTPGLATVSSSIDKTPEVIPETNQKPKPDTKPKAKRTSTKQQESENQSITPETNHEPKEAPKKERKKPVRQPKTAVVANIQPIPVVENTPKAVETIPVSSSLIETTDEPLQVMDVIQIVLKPFTHNKTQYWRETESDKVYKRMPNGKRGAYVGRWDGETQELVKDAPDSDSDE